MKKRTIRLGAAQAAPGSLRALGGKEVEHELPDGTDIRLAREAQRMIDSTPEAAIDALMDRTQEEALLLLLDLQIFTEAQYNLLGEALLRRAAAGNAEAVKAALRMRPGRTILARATGVRGKLRQLLRYPGDDSPGGVTDIEV